MRFADIPGRQKVKERLIRSVSDGRIPHALLFAGPEGNGGLAFALAFAAYIQCTDKVDGDSCGECPSCLKHKKLVHPDLHFSYPVATIRKVKEPKSTDFLEDWRKAVIANPNLGLNDWYDTLQLENKQGFMSVAESQEVIRRLSLKSFESPYKIQIMWLVEKMRTDAFNKLLKIIEEPPDNTIFILITEHRESLLATILSRTQLIRIPTLQVNELAELLENRNGLTVKEAHRIAGLSGGNLNTAMAMVSEAQDGPAFETLFIDWMRLCFSPFRDYKLLVSWVEEISRTGREYQKRFFSFFLDVIRECLLINQHAHSLVRFDDEVVPNFSKFSKFIHAGNAEQLQKAVNQAYYGIERNANPKILFLDLSFKISKLINTGQ